LLGYFLITNQVTRSMSYSRLGTKNIISCKTFHSFIVFYYAIILLCIKYIKIK
jgi:hypothetical protein